MNEKQKGAAKTARIPIKIQPPPQTLAKPAWIRVRTATDPRFGQIKALLREGNLHTVCEEASCPNIGECFSHGTATFMIMGDLCTRRCPFCDVGHGRPDPLNPDEVEQLATSVARLELRHVVITSVDRDDLRDGGAGHFAACVTAVRTHSPQTRIEILVPDFRGRLELALEQLGSGLPDVFNHNLETVPRRYAAVRPGADYLHSLQLLARFRAIHPAIPTKSGLMLGLGERDEEIELVLQDLRAHGVEWLTLGQYLQPTRHHLPVERFVTPQRFQEWEQLALQLGFVHAACGPLVRSSYHAEHQAQGIPVQTLAKPAQESR